MISKITGPNGNELSRLSVDPEIDTAVLPY